MKPQHMLLLTLASLAWACSTGSPATPAFDPRLSTVEPDAEAALDSGSEGEAGSGDATDASLVAQGNTWTYLYATYFGGQSAMETPGHCGRSNCHERMRKNFLCGRDANTCYAGLVAAGLVNPARPAVSGIVSANSPVFWFNPGTGNMPADKPVPNDQAVVDIQAWLLAGATNDGADAGVDADSAVPAADASDAGD